MKTSRGLAQSQVNVDAARGRAAASAWKLHAQQQQQAQQQVLQHQQQVSHA